MDARDAPLPAQIGRYQIRSLIGRGGMGEVYGAYDPSLDRHVALKTIVAGSDNPSLVERLQREARACGRLHHPGIVTIHDLGESEGTVFIAMEWLQGRSLADAMNGDALTFTAKLRILTEILDALAYAHAEGIIHRDIKPSNVWVQPSGHVKLLDFGLARLAHLDALTLPGEVMGTPYYMSPEQLKGHTVDGRTDVFSTGVLGYELLAHRRAFDGESITAIIIKVLGETPPPIGTAWSAAFPEVEAIIVRAMAKSPEDRFPTAEAFAGALRQFMEAHQKDIPRIEEVVTRESSQAVIEAETLLAQGLSAQATERLTAALARDPDAVTIRTMLSGPTVIISQRPPSGPTASAATPAAAAAPSLPARPAMTPPHIISVPRGGTTTVRAPLADPAPVPLAPRHAVGVGLPDAVDPALRTTPVTDDRARGRGWIWMIAALLVLGVGVAAYFNLPSRTTAGASGTGSGGVGPAASPASAGTATGGVTTGQSNQSAGATSTSNANPQATPPGAADGASATGRSGDAGRAGSAGQTGTAAGAAPANEPGRGRQDPIGPGGRRTGGPPLATLSGIGITETSLPNLRGPVAARLFNDEGFSRPVRPGEARWILTLNGDISVRPSPLGGSGLTADYTGEVQILDRALRRTDSRQFEGHVMDFAQNTVRQKASKELADKMADYIVAIIRSR